LRYSYPADRHQSQVGLFHHRLLHGLNDRLPAQYALFASAQSVPVSRVKLVQGCCGMDWRGVARTRKLVVPAATDRLSAACGTIHYVRQRTEMFADDGYA
jgi:hypothetical protein